MGELDLFSLRISAPDADWIIVFTSQKFFSGRAGVSKTNYAHARWLCRRQAPTHRNEKHGRTPDQSFRDQVFDHYKNGQTPGHSWSARPLFFSLTSLLTISARAIAEEPTTPLIGLRTHLKPPLTMKGATKCLTIRADHVFDHFEPDREKPSIGVILTIFPRKKYGHLYDQ